MKFKHCLMLSVFFASLLIAALLLIGNSMNPVSGERVAIVSKNHPSRMVIVPARHTPRQHVKLYHPL